MIDVDHVEKDLDLESAFQNVDIRDPIWRCQRRSRNGEVSIRLLRNPTKNVSVGSDYGNVTIDIPRSRIQRRSQQSLRKYRFGFSGLQNTSHNADHALNGQVGTGGPNIKIDSRYGQVRLTKRGNRHELHEMQKRDESAGTILQQVRHGLLCGAGSNSGSGPNSRLGYAR
jgi:hypothetical protein